MLKFTWQKSQRWKIFFWCMNHIRIIHIQIHCAISMRFALQHTFLLKCVWLHCNISTEMQDNSTTVCDLLTLNEKYVTIENVFFLKVFFVREQLKWKLCCLNDSSQKFSTENPFKMTQMCFFSKYEDLSSSLKNRFFLGKCLEWYRWIRLMEDYWKW